MGYRCVARSILINLDRRSTLEFLVRFADDEIAWLPYSEVDNSGALDTYARSRQCTRSLLLPTMGEIQEARTDARTQILPNLIGRHLRWRNWEIPAVNERIYVSGYAFCNTTALQDADLQDNDSTEYVLEAHITQATTKRFDIRFVPIRLTVAWSLDKCAAYVSRHLEPQQTLLTRRLLEAHPGLLVTLEGTSALPSVPSNRQMTVPTQLQSQLQGKLSTGKWVDIQIQQDKGRYLEVYVPSLNKEITIARSLTRTTEA